MRPESFLCGGEEKSLDADPEYLKRLEEGKVKSVEESAPLEGQARSASDWILHRICSCNSFGCSHWDYFLICVLYIKRLVRASRKPGQVEMGRAIMILMLCAAGLMMVFFKASPEAAVKGSMMKGGLVALISILGVSWLGSSFFEANQNIIVNAISSTIQSHPWIFSAGLFTLSILLFSPAATIAILAPVGIALGLGAKEMIGAYPSVNGLFFLPTYGTILAAVSFDQTGTTRIGKYLLNHSFMIPGPGNNDCSDNHCIDSQFPVLEVRRIYEA